MDSSRFDSRATAQVNVVRALVSGLVWGGLSTVLFSLVAFMSWFEQPGIETVLTMLMGVPMAGAVGFFMPLALLTMTVLIDAVLTRLHNLKPLQLLIGFLLPNAKLATALVMIVADPLVYLIWRISPSFVPVDKYPFIAFAGLINVEKASDEALPHQKQISV